MTTTLRVEVGRVTVAAELDIDGNRRQVVRREWKPSPQERDLEEIDWLFEYSHHTPWGPHLERSNGATDALARVGHQLWADVFGSNRDQLQDVDVIDAVEIWATDAEAFGHPWELLTKPGDGVPLGASGSAIVRRTAASARPPKGGTISRVLLVVARPIDLFEPSLGGVASCVAQQLQGSSVKVDLLLGASFEGVTTSLERASAANRPFDLVHFDTHGLVIDGPASLEPFLVFEGSGRASERVPLDEVLQSVAGNGGGTVVLSACRSLQSPAVGFAAGLDHLVGLSHELHPEAVQRFVEGFYSRLGSGAAVEEATAAGRLSLATSPGRIGSAWAAFRHLVHEGVEVDARRQDSTTSACSLAVSMRFDGPTLRSVDAALRESRVINLFAPKSFGKTTALSIIQQWTDTFLAEFPGLWVDGGSADMGDLLKQIKRHMATVPDQQTWERPLRTALFIDDSDSANLPPDLLADLRAAAGPAVAIVLASRARREPEALDVKVPLSAMGVDELTLRGVDVPVVNDLTIATAGCPQLVDRVATLDEPETLLVSPWSRANQVPDIVPERLLREVGAVSTAALVVSLLAPRYSIAVAVNVLKVIGEAADGAFATDNPEASVRALHPDDRSVATAFLDASSGVTAISFLRSLGMLTSDSDLRMWTHPFGLLAGVAALEPLEAETGSHRLDALAQVYAASVVMDRMLASPVATRSDLAASCMFYCARRGLYVVALGLLGTFKAQAGQRRFADGYIGEGLRESIVANCGGRPGYSDEKARSLWQGSFEFSPSERGHEALRREIDQVHADVAAELDVPEGELEFVQVMQAALDADAGLLGKAAKGYEQALATASSPQILVRALRGLAMLAMDRGDPNAAREYLAELSALLPDGSDGSVDLNRPDDMVLLEAATDFDSGAVWESISRWDSEADASAEMASRDKEAQGRELHERGLASLKLGLLGEARRLLEEAIRLKLEVGDDRLLGTSYLAIAGVCRAEGRREEAALWLNHLSDLPGIRPNQRLSAALASLGLESEGVDWDVLIPIHERAACEIGRAIDEGRRVDAVGCLEWFTALRNARHSKIANSVLDAISAGRFGEPEDVAVAKVLVAERDEPDRGALDVAPLLIPVLEQAADRPGKYLVRMALMKCLAMRCLATKFRVDSGEQVPAADRRCASDDSLRAAEIASEIAGEVELDQLTGMLALAVEVSDRRTVQGWMRLLRVVERIPRDDLYWDVHSVRAIHQLLVGPGGNHEYPHSAVIAGIAAKSADGPASIFLCVGFSRGVASLVDQAGPRIVPPSDLVEPVLAVFGNVSTNNDAWVQTAGCVLPLAISLAIGGSHDALHRLVEGIFLGLAERKVWGKAEAALAHTLYDGLVALPADVEIAKAGAELIGRFLARTLG